MIEIPESLLQSCYEHGASTFPEEACGVLSGPEAEAGLLADFFPMENTLGKLHAEDPARYPRTPREGYVLDPAAFMKLEKALAAEGKKIRVIYLVCGIKERRPDGSILAAFNAETKAFDQQKVP